MTLCGKCLHHVDCHSKDNGQFMHCSACNKICDIEQFKEQHEPTSLEDLVKIQLGREYSKYIPPELKKMVRDGRI